VLACPQQAEGGTDDGIVSGGKGLARAPDNLSAFIAVARMWRWGRRAVDDGIGKADVGPGVTSTT
jgi:hypothetical protein